MSSNLLHKVYITLRDWKSEIDPLLEKSGISSHLHRSTSSASVRSAACTSVSA